MDEQKEQGVSRNNRNNLKALTIDIYNWNIKLSMKNYLLCVEYWIEYQWKFKYE